MAKQGNLFALTSPDGTVGIFHQLGTATQVVSVFRIAW